MKLVESSKEGVTIETEKRPTQEIERKLIGKILEDAALMRPEGTFVNGMALVIYYENSNKSPGGALACVTAMEHLNEVFADAGIKTLAKHCKGIFRSKND